MEAFIRNGQRVRTNYHWRAYCLWTFQPADTPHCRAYWPLIQHHIGILVSWSSPWLIVPFGSRRCMCVTVFRSPGPISLDVRARDRSALKLQHGVPSQYTRGDGRDISREARNQTPLLDDTFKCHRESGGVFSSASHMFNLIYGTSSPRRYVNFRWVSGILTPVHW